MDRCLPVYYKRSEYAKLLQIRQQCWAGNSGDDPRDDDLLNSEILSIIVLINTDGEKTVSAFRVLGRSDDPYGDIDTTSYTCIWAFTQKITNYKPELEEITLYRVNDGEEAVQVDDPETYLQNNGAYIIEGVDDSGQIRSQVAGTVQPGGYSNATDQEQWLIRNTEIQQGGTGNPDSIWEMFPERSVGAGGQTGSEEIRDPEEEFENEVR